MGKNVSQKEVLMWRADTVNGAKNVKWKKKELFYKMVKKLHFFAIAMFTVIWFFFSKCWQINDEFGAHLNGDVGKVLIVLHAGYVNGFI